MLNSKPLHFLSKDNSTIQQFLHNQQLPGELLSFGAVYLNRKRILQNKDIKKGAYVRVHPQPKVYDSDRVNWSRRIVFENEDFLVVNKPSEIPCQPTLDNFHQNVLKALEKLRTQTFFVTQRLDVRTSGLCVYAKHKRFQKTFNRLLLNRKVRKWYLAGVDRPVRPQTYTHFMHPSAYAPKQLEAKPFVRAKECRLQVFYCRADKKHYDLLIELLTGRTHQIRAQLAFLGCPVLGDDLYGVAGDQLKLKSVGLSFTCPISDRPFRFSLGLGKGGNFF